MSNNPLWVEGDRGRDIVDTHGPKVGNQAHLVTRGRCLKIHFRSASTVKEEVWAVLFFRDWRQEQGTVLVPFFEIFSGTAAVGWRKCYYKDAMQLGKLARRLIGCSSKKKIET